MSLFSRDSFSRLSSQTRVLLSWLMIALLSISPGLILTWDWNPSGEESWIERQILDKWNKEQDALSERLNQASGQEFWCRESALRFKKLVQAMILRSYSPADAFLKAQDLIGKSFANLKPELIHFVREGNDWKVLSTIKTSSNYMLRQLFRQIVEHFAEGRSQLATNSWEQRIKSMFGKMAYGEIFMPENRLKPVPVIFQGHGFYLTWDLLYENSDEKSGEKIAGGFFLLIPGDFSRNNEPGGQIIANWSLINDAISGSENCWPAFYNFLATDSTAIILHECLENDSDRRAIQDFFYSNFSQGGTLKQGMDLPVEKVGKAFRLGNRIGRLCYSDPVSGFAALLLADMPSMPVSPRLLVAGWYFRIILIIWLLFAIRAAIFGRLPAIGITVRVLLWFLAFASFPAGLTIGSQTANMQDFREVKVAGLHRELHQLVLQLEAEMAVVSNEFLEAALKVWSDKTLASRARNLSDVPGAEKDFLTELSDGFKSNHIEPSALVLVVQGGWCFTLFSEESSSRFQKSCRTLFGSLLDSYLRHADPDLYSEGQPKGKISDPERRLPSVSSLTDFRVYQNFALVKEKFESISDVFSGNDYSLSFIHQLNIDSRALGVFIALFNPEKKYLDTLKVKLPERAFEYLRKTGFSPDIAVFKTEGAGNELILSTGKTDGFRRITRATGERTAYLYDRDYASIIVPSQRMPGFVFVARLPAYQIESQVYLEHISMLGSLVLLILVVLTGSVLASFWVGKPLRDFVPDLESIRNGGDLVARAAWREDEIASTAFSIRRMADWVKEREKIKKFVAPQAISHVLASNFIKAGAGTLRKVIVLVSDIRSFTTISEEHPAEEVFDMVNSHLGSMSEIIEKWGGVIDRFVGDAVWAIFYEDEHPMAVAAIEAAMEMKQAHTKNQQERAAAGKFTVRTGIGLARGEILAGIMGNSGVRLDYTIAGRTLQEAEDAEGASKMCRHSGIVISRNLKDDLPGYVFEEIAASDGLFEVVSFAAEK
ncbi:MAG: adenylate/guanylate cyclase domain-containing protein [Candidatus Riflebacteria bacterium]|nr:adenylate/guanylate cyclase domain-containing protein [Candidatus Riflebacteria bacterium]